MKKIFIKFTALTVILALMTLLLPPISIVNAADLTSKEDTLTTLTKSVVANHEILFTTPTGLASSETIILTFDSTFSVASSMNYEDIDLSFDATPDGICETGDTQMTLAADPSGTTMGVVRTSGTVITFINGSTTVSAGGEICIQIGTNATEGATGVEQIINATTAASYTLAISGTIGAPDSGNIEIQILDDDSVAVTATVAESLTFAIADVAIGFGTLVAANARFASGDASGTDGPTSASAHIMTVATNATSGYTVTYNGATLTSGSDTIDVATIAGDEDGTPGGEQFAIGFTTDGDATITTAYDQVSPTFKYTFVTSTTTAIITESGPTATETFSAFYLANISGATEAGSYSTSIVYIASANF